MNDLCFITALALSGRTALHDTKSSRRCSFDRYPVRYPRCRVAPTACVPRSVEDTVRVASRSIEEAASQGVRQMQLGVLVPGLNPSLEENVPYNEGLLFAVAAALATECNLFKDAPKVSLLFKSAGTAASASQNYKKNEEKLLQNPNVSIASFDKRDQDFEAPSDAQSLSSSGNVTAEGSGAVQDSAKPVNLIVNPVSARGDPLVDHLAQLTSNRQSEFWIMLNPDFTADRSALGLRDMGKREAFLQSFAQIFYFRNLFEIKRPKLIPVERGMLLYLYPGPWKVYRYLRDEYDEVGQYDREPTREQITTAIEDAPKPARVQVKVPALGSTEEDKAFLGALAAFAVVCSAVFWYVRTSVPRL